MEKTTGIDLKVERIRARVTATQLARQMRVTRQRVSAIEALGVVHTELAERYRAGLESVTSEPQMGVEVA